MAEKQKPVRRYAVPYLLLGLLLGLILVLILSVVWLSSLNTPITLENIIQLHLTLPLFLVIDVLVILACLIFCWVGIEKERVENYRWQSMRLTEQHQAGQTELELKREEELTRYNEQMEEQGRKFQELEAVIRRGKQQWEATFDTVDDLIILTDEEGTILRCNRATGEDFQLGYSQIIGRRIDDLFSNATESLLETLPDEKKELKMPNQEVWYETSKHHLLLEGQQEGWVYIIRNITAQKQALLDQQRLTHYYELLVNNSPVAIVTLNAEDRIIDCNPAFESLFQYGKREVLGWKADLLISPSDLVYETRGMADAVRQGERVYSITKRKRKDGSLLDVEVYGIPVVLGGKQVGSLGLYHDVSELVRARKAASEEAVSPRVQEAPDVAAGILMSQFLAEAFDTAPPKPASEEAAIVKAAPLETADEQNLVEAPLETEAEEAVETALGETPADEAVETALAETPADEAVEAALGETPADEVVETALAETPAEDVVETALGETPADEAVETALGETPADEAVEAALGETPAEESFAPAPAVAAVAAMVDRPSEAAPTALVDEAASVETAPEAFDEVEFVPEGEPEPGPAQEEPPGVLQPAGESLAAPLPTQTGKRLIPVEQIEGIGPVYAQKLSAVGVKYTTDLLDLGKTQQGREELVEKTGISSALVMKWVNMADLMRVHGIGEEYSELLERTGVDTVKELRSRNPKNLFDAMMIANETHKLVRRVPHLAEVEGWINEAKELEPVVSY
jgi:PAS domain S-box-containing protein